MCIHEYVIIEDVGIWFAAGKSSETMSGNSRPQGWPDICQLEKLQWGFHMVSLFK